jgi:simple sugar transport system permease protein
LVEDNKSKDKKQEYKGSAMLKKTLKSHEFVLFLILMVVSLAITIKNPAFFSTSTVFDIARSSLVYCIMGLGVLMVLISGGVDISFVSIASMSSYTTHMLLLSLGYDGGIALYFVVAAILGLLAGLLNGFIISRFNLPVFHVSLGSLSLWYGFTLFFVGATANFDLPEGLVGYYGRFLLKAKDPLLGEVGLHISIIYLVVIAASIWWLLRYTVFGRGLYAMGGNREVAIRVGFNVRIITLIMFGLVGVLAAIAGVTQSGYGRYFNPVLFFGQELNVLAAVIIGGASITGGRGSVIGTILGVVLIDVLNRSFILVGIPADWQRLVIGLVLIIFISIPTIKARRAKRLGHTIELEER